VADRERANSLVELATALQQANANGGLDSLKADLTNRQTKISELQTTLHQLEETRKQTPTTVPVTNYGASIIGVPSMAMNPDAFELDRKIAETKKQIQSLGVETAKSLTQFNELNSYLQKTNYADQNPNQMAEIQTLSAGFHSNMALAADNSKKATEERIQAAQLQYQATTLFLGEAIKGKPKDEQLQIIDQFTNDIKQNQVGQSRELVEASQSAIKDTHASVDSIYAVTRFQQLLKKMTDDRAFGYTGGQLIDNSYTFRESLTESSYDTVYDNYLKEQGYTIEQRRAIIAASKVWIANQAQNSANYREIREWYPAEVQAAKFQDEMQQKKTLDSYLANNQGSDPIALTVDSARRQIAIDKIVVDQNNYRDNKGFVYAWHALTGDNAARDAQADAAITEQRAIIAAEVKLEQNQNDPNARQLLEQRGILNGQQFTPDKGTDVNYRQDVENNFKPALIDQYVNTKVAAEIGKVGYAGVVSGLATAVTGGNVAVGAGVFALTMDLLNAHAPTLQETKNAMKYTDESAVEGATRFYLTEAVPAAAINYAETYAMFRYLGSANKISESIVGKDVTDGVIKSGLKAIGRHEATVAAMDVWGAGKELVTQASQGQPVRLSLSDLLKIHASNEVFIAGLGLGNSLAGSIVKPVIDKVAEYSRPKTAEEIAARLPIGERNINDAKKQISTEEVQASRNWWETEDATRTRLAKEQLGSTREQVLNFVDNGGNRNSPEFSSMLQNADTLTKAESAITPDEIRVAKKNSAESDAEVRTRLAKLKIASAATAFNDMYGSPESRAAELSRRTGTPSGGNIPANDPYSQLWESATGTSFSTSNWLLMSAAVGAQKYKDSQEADNNAWQDAITEAKEKDTIIADLENRYQKTQDPLIGQELRKRIYTNPDVKPETKARIEETTSMLEQSRLENLKAQRRANLISEAAFNAMTDTQTRLDFYDEEAQRLKDRRVAAGPSGQKSLDTEANALTKKIGIATDELIQVKVTTETQSLRNQYEQKRASLEQQRQVATKDTSPEGIVKKQQITQQIEALDADYARKQNEINLDVLNLEATKKAKQYELTERGQEEAKKALETARQAKDKHFASIEEGLQKLSESQTDPVDKGQIHSEIEATRLTKLLREKDLIDIEARISGEESVKPKRDALDKNIRDQKDVLVKTQADLLLEIARQPQDIKKEFTIDDALETKLKTGLKQADPRIGLDSDLETRLLSAIKDTTDVYFDLEQ
ncbi:MAG: hypothetical protein HZA82_00360, partial [Thaumarchaeota archaeon]|nr:hypothetical protein [Nitrososphaerota archaeon]